MAKDEVIILQLLGSAIGWGVAERAGVEKFIRKQRMTPSEMKFAIENFKKRVELKSLIGNGLKSDDLRWSLPEIIHRRYFRTRSLFINGFFEEAIVSGCMLFELIFKDKLRQAKVFKPKIGARALLALALSEKIISEKEHNLITAYIITRNETIHDGDSQEKVDAIYLITIVERVITKLYL